MVSHQIIVQLWPGQDNDLAENFLVAVGALALLPGCMGYALHAHPSKPNTWTIQGDWTCPQAMTGHFESAALQRLLGDLRALRAYCLEFSCRGLDT